MNRAFEPCLFIFKHSFKRFTFFFSFFIHEVLRGELDLKTIHHYVFSDIYCISTLTKSLLPLTCNTITRLSRDCIESGASPCVMGDLCRKHSCPMPSIERGEIQVSTSKRTGKIAIGLFVVLSVVVFGSILYTCFTCVDNEIVSVDTDAGYVDDGGGVGDYGQSQDDSDLGLKGDPIAFDPGDWKGIDRGYVVLLPE